MLLCGYCISEAKRKGKIIYVGELKYSLEKSIDKDVPCDCCDEYDDLWRVKYERR